MALNRESEEKVAAGVFFHCLVSSGCQRQCQITRSPAREKIITCFCGTSRLEPEFRETDLLLMSGHPLTHRNKGREKGGERVTTRPTLRFLLQNYTLHHHHHRRLTDTTRRFFSIFSMSGCRCLRMTRLRPVDHLLNSLSSVLVNPRH